MPSRSDYLELYSDLGGYMTDNFGEAYEQYYGTHKVLLLIIQQ